MCGPSKEGKDFGDLSPEIIELYKRSLLIVRSQIDYERRDHRRQRHRCGGGGARPLLVSLAARRRPGGRGPRQRRLQGGDPPLLHPGEQAGGARRLPPAQVQSRRYPGQFLASHGPMAKATRCCQSRRTRVPSASTASGYTTTATGMSSTCVRSTAAWSGPIANFMCDYRDPHTGLPKPSFDLWEERHGIHAFTVGAVWAGLEAAARFAALFGEDRRTPRRYQQRGPRDPRRQPGAPVERAGAVVRPAGDGRRGGAGGPPSTCRTAASTA